MENFLETEVEHLRAMLSFVKACRSYHQHSEQVFGRLEEKLNNSLSLPRSPKAVNRHQSRQSIASSAGTGSISNVAPVISYKKQHDNKPSQPTCRLLYDFIAENENELDVREGDIVRLIEQVDENWYLGEFKGKEGHFPISYGEVLVPL